MVAIITRYQPANFFVAHELFFLRVKLQRAAEPGGMVTQVAKRCGQMAQLNITIGSRSVAN